MTVKMVLLVSSLCLIFIGSAASDSCLTPSLDNGYVLGEGDESTWTGALVCEPGYILVGSSKLKCRNGQWSANMPVCTAIGKCDPDNLPEIQNGRKDPYKTTQYRGAVYKFSCARGYKRLGNSLVHCNGDHWDLQRVPFCSRAGCDESLIADIANGQSKRKAHGGVYFFKCRDGGVLEGSSVVVCDGKSWNDTAPTCLRPTRHPLLSIQVDGAASDEVAAGSPVTVVCDADEGNPEPTLTLFKNGEPLGPPTTGQNTHTFIPLQEDNTAVVSCNAINAAMSEHLSSEMVLNVKFGPSEVHIGGPDLMLAGEAGGYECVSSSSNPPAEIQWMVTNHQGEEATHLLQVSESSTSWADDGWQTSSTAVLHPQTGMTVLHVSCTASNSEMHQQVTDQKQVALKFAPEKVTLSGPSKVLSGSDVSLECFSAASVPAAALTWSVTQAEERLEFSPDESVEQLEDGSFITRSSLSLVASKGHDLVVECYGTNDVMGNDFQAYAHVIEILEKPSATMDPEISYDYDDDEDEYSDEYLYEDANLELNVTDTDNYRLSADGTIETKLSHDDSNEETVDEYIVDETSADRKFEEMEANVTPIAEHGKETAENVSAGHTQNSNTDLDTNLSYSENDIAEVDASADNHSKTNSVLKINLKKTTFENDSDIERKEDHSEIPTDAVYVPHQKQLSNTQSLKASVEVTEATKTKEKDEQKDENETDLLKASQTMNSAKQTQFSFLSMCLTILIAKVTCNRIC